MRVKKNRKLKLLKIEKLLYMVVALLVLLTPVLIVFSSATLSKVNIEVERLKVQIDRQQNKNQSIMMKINELASLENIQLVAESMGLSYNNNNIKVITQ
ncbi:MAG: cell division protein FtsL [Bacilli bacterium]|nr:cell division protein FtsL [Bacilli bacterium]